MMYSYNSTNFLEVGDHIHGLFGPLFDAVYVLKVNSSGETHLPKQPIDTALL